MVLRKLIQLEVIKNIKAPNPHGIIELGSSLAECTSPKAYENIFGKSHREYYIIEDTTAQNATRQEMSPCACLSLVPMSCLPQTGQFISCSSSTLHLTCLCTTVSSSLSCLSRAAPRDSTCHKKCGTADQHRLTGCPPPTKKISACYYLSWSKDIRGTH